ncbi:hypothetical protein SPSIL_056650 [Sporomusa silvacetica DSM 10669]|uniref:DUF2975 domain-containing protein n=1 Tax=Sporomusa silvacetica DSM 10669 TaxID=1123289 RepID=A0ABZ3IUM7_9FIRM|nr:hypothetical protein SPSIL_56700 [Sporomusa silvacetica DSM 10669]
MLSTKIRRPCNHCLRNAIDTIIQEKILSYECILAIAFTLLLYRNNTKIIDVQSLREITSFISSLLVNFLAVYYAALAISIAFKSQITKGEVIKRLTKSRVLKTTVALLISLFLSIYTFIESTILQNNPVSNEYILILITFITLYGIISVGGLILEISLQANIEFNNDEALRGRN